MSAKEEVLARIAAAHAAAPPTKLEYEDISRAYRDEPAHSGSDLVDLLVDRLVDYRARVRTTSAENLPATVAAALAEQGISLVTAPAGLPEEWLRDVLVHILVDDDPLSTQELDEVAGVVSGCAVAVARTGTLVLDASPDQGRRALTLVPDYHLCVVHAADIVPDVPQALVRLDPTRPLTFISGPSATSDIELIRVEGVHGPRTLEVVLVTS